MRRLLAGTLRALGVMAALAALAWGVFVLQPFGQRQWTFGAILAAALWLAAGLRRPSRTGLTPSGGEADSRRIGRTARVFPLAGLCVWLALIAWSTFSPGGRMPPSKSDPDAIRVLTWNILRGVDGGPPWSQHGWPVRKTALVEVLHAVRPDILCVQEALDGQVRLLEAELPGHSREGVGRDDGRTGGEHCAIFFDAARFERLAGGTFWLEDPIDAPPEHLALGPKRICTWVRLRDRPSGRSFRVYNLHSYLTEAARLRASQIIMARVRSGDPLDATLVAGDFNAPPDAPSRALFSEAGLIPSTDSAGDAACGPTYQFYGIPGRSLDEIYASRGWRTMARFIVDAKPQNTFPSDHFGVVADFVLEGRTGRSPIRESKRDSGGGWTVRCNQASGRFVTVQNESSPGRASRDDSTHGKQLDEE